MAAALQLRREEAKERAGKGGMADPRRLPPVREKPLLFPAKEAGGWVRSRGCGATPLGGGNRRGGGGLEGVIARLFLLVGVGIGSSLAFLLIDVAVSRTRGLGL